MKLDHLMQKVRDAAASGIGARIVSAAVKCVKACVLLGFGQALPAVVRSAKHQVKQAAGSTAV